MSDNDNNWGSPKVSIIMASHNGAQWISRAIASVQAQTFQDWELLIGLDHSTDNSEEVIQGFQKQDQRIELYTFDQQCGPSAVRNNLLQAARGEYMQILDDDDELAVDFLEKIWLIAQQNQEVDVWQTGERFVYEDGLSGVSTLREWLGNIWKNVDDIRLDGYLKRPCLAHFFGKTAAVQSVNGYDVRLQRHEDYDLGYRLLREGFKLRWTEVTGYQYYIRAHSLARKSGWGDGAYARFWWKVLVDALRGKIPFIYAWLAKKRWWLDAWIHPVYMKVLQWRASMKKDR